MLGDTAQGERRLIMINSNEAENYSSETFWAQQGGYCSFFPSFLRDKRRRFRQHPRLLLVCCRTGKKVRLRRSLPRLMALCPLSLPLSLLQLFLHKA